MTVGQLAQHFRAVAAIVSAGRGSGKELEEAAAALDTFADHSMAQFATFLKLAEAKYRESGELPDGKVPKPKKEPKEKAPKLGAGDLSSRVTELKSAIERGDSWDRATVTAEINKFEKLTGKDLDAVMTGLHFPAKPKKKADALAAIVNHVLANQTAANRAQA